MGRIGDAVIQSGERLFITSTSGEVSSRRWVSRPGWRIVDQRSLAGPAGLIVAEAV